MTYLERMLISILLPILSIIGKLNLTLKMNMNIIQKGEIKGLSNDKSLTLREIQSTSLVRLLQALVELRRDVIVVVLAMSDSVDLAMTSLDGKFIGMLGAELFNAARNTSREVNGLGENASEEGEG